MRGDFGNPIAAHPGPAGCARGADIYPGIVPFALIERFSLTLHARFPGLATLAANGISG